MSHVSPRFHLVGPNTGTVDNTKDANGIVADLIRSDIVGSGNDDFACAVYAPDTPAFGKIDQPTHRFLYPLVNGDCRVRVIRFDIDEYLSSVSERVARP